jgi:hypothetical protein
MRRREFITHYRRRGSGAAQKPAIPVIGFLYPSDRQQAARLGSQRFAAGRPKAATLSAKA